MPILFLLQQHSGGYPDIAEKAFKEESLYIRRHFFPLGEPISLHRLRCSPFAVYKYSFMGYFLAAATILARE